MALTEDGATTLAMHARGTPRVVNRFVRRIRDLAQVEGRTEIDSEIAKRGLAMLGVDDDGLLPVDRAILQVLLSAEGRPVGLRTIAASVGEDDRTLEDVYEPHLMRTGLVLKTPRGRILTAAAYDLLQVEAPTPQEEPEEQPGLFDG
jgi:Holliday junction DNA helicase RuvB